MRDYSAGTQPNWLSSLQPFWLICGRARARLEGAARVFSPFKEVQHNPSHPPLWMATYKGVQNLKQTR